MPSTDYPALPLKPYQPVWNDITPPASNNGIYNETSDVDNVFTRNPEPFNWPPDLPSEIYMHKEG